MFSTQSSGAVNSAVNAVTDAASGAVNAVTNAASGTVNAVTNAGADAVNAVANVGASAATAVSNAANNIFKSVNKATNSAVNTVSNSLMPIGNKSSKNSNNFMENRNNNRNANISPKNAVDWLNPFYIFIGLVLVFLMIFTFYSDHIKSGYQYAVSSIRNALGMPVHPDVTSAISPTIPVTIAPEAPQNLTLEQESMPQPSQKSIVERVLPSGGEVFNVAQNKFTYYDAEPLCKALGAELATYEQVKDAWGQGADWCNYGWVKGQMAVYPTQSETYNKLQSGPDDQKRACGTVGINGGYFDNPEFKYGVNCYGKKPDQSAHDQMMLMSEGKAPKSPESLKVDQLVNEFKDESDSLFIKPFNNEKWVSA